MNTLNFPTIDAALEKFLKPDGELESIIKDFEMRDQEVRDLAQEFSALLDQYNNLKASGRITPEVESKLSTIIKDHFPK